MHTARFYLAEDIENQIPLVEDQRGVKKKRIVSAEKIL